MNRRSQIQESFTKRKGKMSALFDITSRDLLPYNWIDKCREKRVVAKHAKMPKPVKQHRDANLSSIKHNSYPYNNLNSRRN